MKIQKPLKSVALMLATAIAFAGAKGFSIAETTLDQTDGTIPASELTSIVEQVEETTTETINWWKAEIADYDSSLSLISYEQIDETTSTTEITTETTTETTTATVSTTTTAPTPFEVEYVGGNGSVSVPQQQEVPNAAPASGEFAFTTYGWGHGVGMSQNGANFYATYAGWSYQDILFHYYQGTSLINTGTSAEEIVSVGGVQMDMLSAMAGIVYREVGSSMHPEAIKAQAVAVYTYLKFYGNDSNDLRCKSNPPQNVIDICTEVLGEALIYDGDYVLAMFSASSGGYSANCYDVFTADVPYLRSVYSEYDEACDPHYGTVVYMSASDVKSKLQSYYGITLSDNPENWFLPYIGDSGYIYSVDIDGQISVRGNDLRYCLGLKSSKYDIAYAQ